MTRAISEADFQKRIIDYARLRGWKVCHVRPAQTTRGWRTPYQGDSGLPDLILARNGRVMLAELKSDAAPEPSEAQYAWIGAAGMNGRVWRPHHWDSIVEELK